MPSLILSLQTAPYLIISHQEWQERIVGAGEGEENRRNSMEVEQPLQSLSGDLQSPLSIDSASTNNSLGSSSLDTASANGRLEHYEIPWSFSDINGGGGSHHHHYIRNERSPHRSRSYGAFLDWNSTIMTPGDRQQHLTSVRPLGGASRRRLVRQIQELTRDKAELQAQLEAIARSGPLLKVSRPKSAEQGQDQKDNDKAISVDGFIHGIEDGTDEHQVNGERLGSRKKRGSVEADSRE